MKAIVIALVGAVVSVQAKNSYVLSHYEPKPNEVIWVNVHSDASPGVLTVTKGTKVNTGSISIKWNQMLQRSVQLNNGVKKLRYRVLKDVVVREAEIAGKKDRKTIESPLVGETVTGMQDAMGTWKMFLDQVAGAEQSALIEELESYEKRRWFVEQPVRVGDSWDFNPSFIKHMMERDLKGAKVKAKMKLKEVRQLNGKEVGIVSFSINSIGVTHDSDASITLNGEVEIDLERMFDYKVTMQGNMVTASTHKGVTTVVKSPIKYLVTKEVR